MTAQTPDTVTWSGARWHLAGYDGAGLFDPEEHGLRPFMLSTANWRGFVCRYAFTDDRLVLDRLEIGLRDAQLAEARAGRGPLLGGVAPAGGPEGFQFTYEDVGLPIAYTGTLLLADGFIQELYVHMGFHPAWKYERVTELHLVGGVLERSEDVSDRYARVRANPDPGDLPPPRGADGNRVSRWIASVFDRSYGTTRRG
jgi:hypothetical protein